jgi:hypothetical protein
MTLRRFLPLLACAAFINTLLAPGLHAQTSSTKGTVSGKFLGDGKDGKIQFLVVQDREAFNDKPAIRLIFTEKNPGSSQKPDFDAAFKRLGSALIISVFKDGGIFGCEVAHTAHPKSPFSALGEIKMKNFKVTDTTVSGQVTTGGTLDAFGQKWDVDLTFSAPLPKGAFAAAAPTPKPAEEKEEEEAKPTGPKIPVAKLPLPAGALDVEYKKTVEHINFRSDASVSAVAGDFSKKLKQEGWKESSGSLMNPKNAILKRELNGAELTIMVQPASSGCTVKIFTKGLDWSAPPASSAPKPAKKAETNDIEAEANRMINDALKQIPGR